MNSDWIGWIIEQSLNDLSILDVYKTLKLKSDNDDWKEHVLEIPDDKIEDVIQFLKDHLFEGWYAHILRNDQVWVIFNSKAFLAHVGDDYNQIESYATSHGVPKEQIDVADLFVQACEEVF